MSATWKEKHPEKHREYQRLRSIKKRAELATHLTNLKRERGCDSCGYTEPCALVYVHRPDETKSFDVNLRAWSRTLAAIDAEIAKCDLLCQNCIICDTNKTIVA